MKSRILKLATTTVIIAAALIAIHQYNGSLNRAIVAHIDNLGGNKS